jgi:hypothetical protein
MRLAVIAFILFAGLTAGNVVVYKREMAGLRDPYAGATAPVAAIVGSAVAQDVSRTALRNAWLREAGALVLVGVLWWTIARLTPPATIAQ